MKKQDTVDSVRLERGVPLTDCLSSCIELMLTGCTGGSWIAENLTGQFSQLGEFILMFIPPIESIKWRHGWLRHDSC
jgi:hypothetical protein